MLKTIKQQKGFTLIELLIVIAILGILAAGAGFGVVKFLHTGAASAANTEISTLQTAVMAYEAGQNTPANVSIATLTSQGYLSSSPVGTYTDPIVVDSSGNITINPLTYPRLNKATDFVNGKWQ
jgi:prepilin-type N-terminal cleavage/methylation domain-containing protein